MKKLVVCALCAAMVIPAMSVSVSADSKELVLYTWENMFPQEVLDGFEEETGIKVVYSNFDTDENMLEKLSMAKGGDYDVVVADDYIIETAIQEGLVEKLDTSKLSGWDNINPLYQGQFYDPNDEYTAPYGAGIPLIVYDPDMVDIDIKGYNDLWDPSLEDSIALTANYRVINGITNLVLGQDFNDQDTDDIAKTGEKLLELAPNVRLIQDDNTQDSLLNGEASVAFLYTSQVTAALQENPDLKVVYPEEGLGFGVMGMFIPSQAPDKDEAYQFMDYILQPENAAKCFDYIGYYSTNKAADSAKPSTSEKITVQAAASLKGALTELADAYKKSHNLADDQIAINFAGSGTLRQQIEQGAPASLFISADEKNMKMLQEKDLVTDVKPFVTNELVLVVPKGQPKVELNQIATVKRIVLGNPETVPAGNYGKQVLTKLGVWEQVEPNVVYAKDVKAVTASISQGAGDAGFIYKTDAIAAGDAVEISAVTPADSHDPVIYPIGIIKKYDNALAKDFYQYVMSPEGQKVLEKYGFSTSK